MSHDTGPAIERADGAVDADLAQRRPERHRVREQVLREPDHAVTPFPRPAASHLWYMTVSPWRSGWIFWKG